VQGESADATARRIAEGEGYPHEAVPGEFACAWSTEKQRLAMNSDQASAQPPLSAKVGTTRVNSVNVIRVSITCHWGGWSSCERHILGGGVRSIERSGLVA
jgi:hypothetical protein